MWGKSRKILLAIATGLLVAILAAGFAYSFPADLALLAALDVSAYVDALVGVYLVASVARLRPLLHMWKQRLIDLMRIGRRHGRQSASREIRDSAAADNDDDPARRAIMLAA